MTGSPTRNWKKYSGQPAMLKRQTASTYERRRIEGNRLRPWHLGWWWDRAFRHVAGYGTRVWPVVVAVVVLLFVLNPWVFTRPGAVIEKEKREGAASTPATSADTPHLGWFDAFGVGSRLVVGIEVVSGSRWVPSENWLLDKTVLQQSLQMRYSTYATLQRIVGWLLVPIVVASFVEHFRRPRG